MANKKYDFNKPAMELDGSVAKEAGKTTDLTLAKELAKIIMYSNIAKEDIVMKYFAWGNDLQQIGVLELDDTDKETLSKYILSHPNLSILSKGQLMQVLKVLPAN